MTTNNELKLVEYLKREHDIKMEISRRMMLFLMKEIETNLHLDKFYIDLNSRNFSISDINFLSKLYQRKIVVENNFLFIH